MSIEFAKKVDDIVVVKVGTSTLTKKRADGSEELDVASFERIGQEILEIQKSGTHVVLVSSAAITAGMVETGSAARPSKESGMPELQRLASIGWRKILNAWDLATPGATVGELLLTRHELSVDSERDEALQVIYTLLTCGDLPIVNENDAITHEEISLGDNDALAANLAVRIKHSALFGHVRLVLLSDIDGVYEDKNDASTIIREIDNVEAHKHLAGGAGSTNGTGGMLSKFAAAKLANYNGIEMWIANGRDNSAIQRVLAGEIGTKFKV
jgi:glutamate 5-kinase